MGNVEKSTAIATRPNGDVLVGGLDGSKYAIFSAEGEYLNNVPLDCNSKLRSFATDSLGRLYAACYGDQLIAVHSPDDEPLGTINVPFPSGVAILPSF